MAGETFHVDMSHVWPKLKLALDCYSKEVQRRALYNTLNTACQPLRTAVRRHVTKQTSAPYSRVAAHIKDKRAHPNRLSYHLIAKDKAMRLSEFRGTLVAGKQNPKFKVWNKNRTFHGAFVVPLGGKLEVVKRVAKHESRGGPLGVKVLYGPIIPKEMLREGFPSRAEIAETIPKRVLVRLPHELEQAVIRAKAASGT